MGYVLITRPEPSATQLCEVLKKRGYETLSSPSLIYETRQIGISDLSSYDALVFTSAQAIHSLFDQDHSHHFDLNKPVFTVGKNTDRTAHSYNFLNTHCADGNAQDLINLITQYPYKNILYLCGAHISTDIRTPLKSQNISVTEAIIYEALLTNDFSEDTRTALSNDQIDVVLFFSKRSAEIFMNLITKNGYEQQLATIKCLCISDSVLEYVRNYTWKDTYSAKAPNQDSMIDCLDSVRLKT